MCVNKEKAILVFHSQKMAIIQPIDASQKLLPENKK